MAVSFSCREVIRLSAVELPVRFHSARKLAERALPGAFDKADAR